MLDLTNPLVSRACHAFAAVALCAALAACGRQADPPAPPPVEVSALQLQPRDLPLQLEYPAQLRGIREVEVRARVSGILLQRLYREGSRVKAGDLLFRIDPAPFRAEVERARAELEVQQANLRQAERERDRILAIYEQKLVSSRDRDNAIAAYESALAAVSAAKARLRSAELDLSYTEVRAPISGLTGREARSEGSLVNAGTESSLLTHIVQTDRLYVEFAVPQSEAASLRAAVRSNAGSVSVQLVDTRGESLGAAGRIEFIAPDVGDETGTVGVRAIVENRDGTLLPGQVVRARVSGVTLANSLVIPKRAVMRGMQGPFVWVIGDDDKISPRPVTLGAASGNEIVVIDGLAANDRIVVDGILKVQPGALVRAVPIGTEGASQAAPATTVKAAR